MFTSIASSNEPDEAPQVVSLRVVAEERRIAVIMRGGDVVMVSLDEEDSPVRADSPFCFNWLDLVAGGSRRHLRVRNLGSVMVSR